MTRSDAEEAIAALGRAILALSADPPDTKTASAEIAEASGLLQAVPDLYADKTLRPGLNAPESFGQRHEIYGVTQQGHIGHTTDV
jgi:hypothetical protein